MVLLTFINAIWILVVTFTLTSMTIISYNYINRLKIISINRLLSAIIIENIALLLAVSANYKRFITNDPTFDTGLPYAWILIIAIISGIMFYYCYETENIKQTIKLEISQFIAIVIWIVASDIARETLVTYNTVFIFNIWFLACIIPLLISILLMHRNNWMTAEDSRELSLYDVAKSLVLFIFTEYASITLIKSPGLSVTNAAQIITVIAASIIFLDYIIYNKIYHIRYLQKTIIQYSSYIVGTIILLLAFAIKQ